MNKGIASVLISMCSLVTTAQQKTICKPVVDGNWWNITSQPELGTYAGDHQEPVDFAVWKAKDGTWQLWSCVRGTKIGGNTRLFYKWEGKRLTDTAWEAKGIAMTADEKKGETAGGLQAPFVFRDGHTFHMFYGDWNNICHAKSLDGKSFRRVLNEQGKSAMFAGPLYNSRDPMVLKIGKKYYCYYCGHHQKDDGTGKAQAAVFCRLSSDLRKWSDPVKVSSGGSPLHQTNWFGGDTECPFVVKTDSFYVLFRNQRYGEDNPQHAVLFH